MPDIWEEGGGVYIKKKFYRSFYSWTRIMKVKLSYLRSRCAFTLVSLDICKCIFWNVWCCSRIICIWTCQSKKTQIGEESCWALTLVVGSVVSWLCDLFGYNHYPHCPKPWPQTRRWRAITKRKDSFFMSLTVPTCIVFGWSKNWSSAVPRSKIDATLLIAHTVRFWSSQKRIQNPGIK